MIEPTYLMTIFLVYAFLWGAIWGSFLNVVIWRLPRGMNLARPASHCPACQSLIRWYDNIPILGWLLLRGRCRACSTQISARYPFVELLVALLSTLLMWHVGRDTIGVEPHQVVVLSYIFPFFFILALVAIAFIDFDLTIIPHSLTFPLMAWGLLGALLTPKTGAFASAFPLVDIVDASIGMAAGAGIILAVFYGYRLVTGRIGLGGGDVTMMAMIGANLGWMCIPIILMLSSFQGIIVAVGVLLWERSRGQRAGEEGSIFIAGAHSDAFWETVPEPTPVRRDGGEAVANPPAADASSEPDEEASTPRLLARPKGEVPHGGTHTDADIGSAPVDEPRGADAEAGEGADLPEVTDAENERATTDGAGGESVEAPSGSDSSGSDSIAGEGGDPLPSDGATPGDASAADASAVAGVEEEETFMKLAVPFGPFLALAAIQYVFVGRPILQWLTAGIYP